MLQSSLAREQQKRGADRAGRIRAEQQLKQLHLQLAAAAAGSRGLQQHEPAELHLQGQHAANGACEGAGSSNGAAAAAAAKVPELSVFPFTAIGTLKSCFTSRCVSQRVDRAELKQQQACLVLSEVVQETLQQLQYRCLPAGVFDMRAGFKTSSGSSSSTCRVGRPACMAIGHNMCIFA